MRNRGRRSRGSDDINLTPLLDVLFVILFIVMLAGTQTQKDMQESAEESRSRISGLEEQVTDLEEQNTILQSEVSRKNKIEDSGKRYESDAVIVTFINEVEDGNHVLRIYKGSDQEVESFRLGSDRTDYTKRHVTEIINLQKRGVCADSGRSENTEAAQKRSFLSDRGGVKVWRKREIMAEAEGLLPRRGS